MSRRGTEWFARAVIAAQKSAEGIVVAGATKARTMDFLSFIKPKFYV